MSPEHQQKLISITERLVAEINGEGRVELRHEMQEGVDATVVSIYTPGQARFLIGKNGQNLQALEHVIRAIFSKSAESTSRTILVDVNDYRRSRASRVIEIARDAVARVRNTQKAEALMPMSSYERRVVHMELASMPDVATESIGQEPQRRIIIKPYNP